MKLRTKIYLTTAVFLLITVSLITAFNIYSGEGHYYHHFDTHLRERFLVIMHSCQKFIHGLWERFANLKEHFLSMD